MGELRSVLSSAVGTLLLLFALGLDEVRAQQPTPSQISAIRGSCRSDFMANCSGVQPGGRDALKCLIRNMASLSPSCQAAVSAVIPAPAQPAAATPAAPPPAVAAPPTPPPATAAAPSEPVAAPPPAAPAAIAPKPPARPAAMGAAAPAHQPSAAQNAAIRQSCRSDFMAHCAGVTPGGKDALTCLQRNARRLSPGCKAAIAVTMRAPAGAAPPPAPVEEAAPVPPPPAAAVAPLKLRPFILPQRRVVIVAICGAEVQRLCADVPPGGERILVCLALNASQLSPACYDAVARVSRR
jgi:hypothetical protein